MFNWIRDRETWTAAVLAALVLSPWLAPQLQAKSQAALDLWNKLTPQQQADADDPPAGNNQATVNSAASASSIAPSTSTPGVQSPPVNPLGHFDQGHSVCYPPYMPMHEAWGPPCCFGPY